MANSMHLTATSSLSRREQEPGSSPQPTPLLTSHNLRASPNTQDLTDNSSKTLPAHINFRVSLDESRQDTRKQGFSTRYKRTREVANIFEGIWNITTTVSTNKL